VEPPIARVSLISWSALLARPVKSMARFILKISADATERARPVLALWCAAVGKYAQALVFSCAVALWCGGEPRRSEDQIWMFLRDLRFFAVYKIPWVGRRVKGMGG
jgi:hypothetical protein